jgi:hypothetical protein
MRVANSAGTSTVRSSSSFQIATCEDADDVAKDGAVEVGIFGGDLGGSGGWRGIGPMEGRNVDGADPLAGAFESRRGHDGFQFADVAGPGVGGEAREGAGAKPRRFLVLQAPVTEKEAGKEGDVFFAVAERRQGEADGGEVTGEVGIEGTCGGQTAEWERGAGDQLERRGVFCGADALVRDALEKIAEVALLFRGELIDAGEIDEAGAGVFPESLGLADELSGHRGDEGSGSSGTETMEGLGSE